ncbi:MAG: hypothetical protein KatS3mg045_1321 [Bellilinea sp.]|nr:MAG: hypothetical protein KatS3mg045_1321 [Bellilinea sp.]
MTWKGLRPASPVCVLVGYEGGDYRVPPGSGSRGCSGAGGRIALQGGRKSKSCSTLPENTKAKTFVHPLGKRFFCWIRSYSPSCGCIRCSPGQNCAWHVMPSSRRRDGLPQVICRSSMPGDGKSRTRPGGTGWITRLCALNRRGCLRWSSKFRQMANWIRSRFNTCSCSVAKING